MKEKIDFTKNILNKISKNLKQDTKIKSNNYKNTKPNNIDDNSYIMIPTNHKNIKEILKILNNENLNYKKETNKIKNNEEKIKREVITLNDIINSNKESINISKDSIITPMAKDYIKQKKIKIKIGG
ncbi:hypothetical protein GCM10008904_29540 [Paraclostridium ghonii]|uniref:RND superfamily exporter protein n=1 Tax=Paraclostridium ghonii TaxID=29358 RepID=A0ABU0MXM0_9FIRM|nr:hypothetical protein [Paeniclostridium ghonii]MCM0166215.1 hypothetical protein [Paeniclostridium ghonii]MDQ0555642.1 putative RND superfamily exporter protein [Paeniclostridium ghonii]